METLNALAILLTNPVLFYIGAGNPAGIGATGGG